MNLSEYEKFLLEKKAIKIVDNKIVVCYYKDEQCSDYITKYKLDFDFDVFEKLAQPTKKEKEGNHFVTSRTSPGKFVPRYYWDSKKDEIEKKAYAVNMQAQQHGV